MTRPEHPDGLTRRAHTVIDLFHKECWKYLTGNGSEAMPYTCKCGTWQFDRETYEYRLVSFEGGDGANEQSQ